MTFPADPTRLPPTVRRSRHLAALVGVSALGILLPSCHYFSLRGKTPRVAVRPGVTTDRTDQDALARVLRDHVDGQGRVDYRRLEEQRADLDAYALSVASLDPRVYGSWSEARKIAFWCNTYNALTLQVILANHPIRSTLHGLTHGAPSNSIRQIPGVWDEVEFTVMSRPKTLGEIEHEILRKQFHEPRIHFAINCASKSCPALRGEPYRAESLHTQLEDQVHRFLSDPANFHVDEITGDVHWSAIFDWFGEDFVADWLPAAGFGDGGDAQRAALAFVAAHVDPTTAEHLLRGPKVHVLDYDWTLNEPEVEDESE